MSVVARKRAHRTTYYVVFSFEGRRVWERSGVDRREAERLDARRRAEVRGRTYRRAPSPQTPFGVFLKAWLDKRKNRNADDDRALVERYLLGRAWLAALPCEQIRPRHAIRLVEELKETVSDKTGRTLSHKYVSNLYGLFSVACSAARIEEVMPFDPCELPRGTLRRKAARNVRSPYGVPELRALAAPRTMGGVFAAIAFYTGMREGEVCGRRWRDWDRETKPLGCLLVHSQYDDQPLKGDRAMKGEAARKVPVHPELAQTLAWWWSEGFEWTYCRKPTPDDFIVPRRDGRPHTKSSAYKLWRKACAATGVTNLSLHSTRHTFITRCRRGGARAEVVERITHNASGDTVDQYTHWEWEPLCEAVLCLLASVDATVDASSESSGKEGWRRRESKSGRARRVGGKSRKNSAIPGADDPPETGANRAAGARCAARQQGSGPARLPRTGQQYVAARILDAASAVRRGDEIAAQAALAKAARVFVGSRGAA